MRVVFSNNYSMARARAEIGAGHLPSQHLYGADHLARHHDVQYTDFDEDSLLTRASRRVRWRLGDLHQERQIVRAGSSLVCYGAEPNSTAGLAALRSLGRWRHPLVSVVHQLPAPTLRMGAVLRGTDVVICLSSYVRDRLQDTMGREDDSVVFAPWGPDLSFSGYGEPARRQVVSVGKTNRDQATLMAALARVGVPGTVYARSPRGLDVPAGVRLVTDATDEDRFRPEGPKFSYRHVLSDLLDASVVAIPLADPARVSGLSEVNDALALGVPIIATRSPYLADVDIEQIGCGIWVAAGDVAGWAAAIRSLTEDPDLARSMGLLGRRFVEDGWNADAFGASVLAACERVAA